MTKQEILERRKMMYDRYQQGASYSQIAREFGINKKTAYVGIQIYTDMITDYSRL